MGGASSKAEAETGLAVPFTVTGKGSERTVELYTDDITKEKLGMKLTFTLNDDGITALIAAENLTALAEKCYALRREYGSPEVKTANAEADAQEPTIPPEEN